MDKCRPVEKGCEVRRAEDELRAREQRAEVEVLMWRLAREMRDQGYPDRY